MVLLVTSIIIGLVLGLLSMLFMGSTFMGGQKFALFILIFIMGFACAFIPANPEMPSQFLHLSFLQNPMIVQAAAGITAGILSLIIAYVLGMFSGGGLMIGNGVKLLIVLLGFALVFAAPYIAAIIPVKF